MDKVYKIPGKKAYIVYNIRLELCNSQSQIYSINLKITLNSCLYDCFGKFFKWCIKLIIPYSSWKDEVSTTVFGNEEGEQGSDAWDRRKSSYRAVLEKKLSIAERAIATNPCSITLQLERLKICQELWEPSVLAKEWKKLVRVVWVSVWYTLSLFLALLPLCAYVGKLAKDFRWNELLPVNENRCHYRNAVCHLVKELFSKMHCCSSFWKLDS